MAYIDIMPA